MQKLKLKSESNFPENISASEDPAKNISEQTSSSANSLMNNTSKSPKANDFSSNQSFGPTYSRDEMNLVEFPLAVLSTRVNPKLKTLEFNDSKRLSSGETINREWIITGADKFGLPTSTDDDVILALMRLTVENGFQDRKIYFTRYELLKILRWTTEGRSYRRLTKSLDRLSGVRIKASNSFFSNKDKAYQTRNFGLIDAYEINDGRSKKQARNPYSQNESNKDLLGKGSKSSFFIWSEVLFKSFQDGYIKKINLELYFSLKSAVSRRLYRYLDKHFFYKNVIDCNLMILAFEKLGVSRNYRYVSSVRQQLEPAIEELLENGYLQNYAIRGRGGETMVRFIYNNQSSTEKKHPALLHTLERNDSSNKNHLNAINKSGNAYQTSLDSYNRGSQQGESRQTETREQAQIIEMISSRGVNENIAKKLLRARTVSECQYMLDIIRYYDHLVATRDIKVSKNAIGFLYRAVENPSKFQIPASFKDKQDVSSQVQTPRPEHKIFNSVRSNTKSSKEGSQGLSSSGNRQNSNKKLYQSFISAKLSIAEAELGPLKLEKLRQDVTSKFDSMKGVLSETQLGAAIEGCIKKEIMDLFNIPEEDVWMKEN